MAQKLYEESNIQAIANAIREKNGETTTYKPSEMAAAILAITTGGSSEGKAYVFSRDCRYLFANTQIANVLLADLSKISFSETIYWMEAMFKNCSGKEDLSALKIPLGTSTNPYYNGSNDLGGKEMFYGCATLKSFPQMIKADTTLPYRLIDGESMFYGCAYMRELPDWMNGIRTYGYTERLSNGVIYEFYGTNSSYMFYKCYSLRDISTLNLTYFQGHKSGNIYYGASSSPITKGGFCQCYCLDELSNVPIFENEGENLFSPTFVASCYRLKKLTFRGLANSNLASYNNFIDLSNYVGYAGSSNAKYILNYNSGITADKEVTDNATYQALKNDPDWFTTNVAYSRYNHDSAVETINSLPSTTGGTNTIKFKGEAGSATDGGAINTLTEEQIAVATAKGWTVSLV